MIVDSGLVRWLLYCRLRAPRGYWVVNRAAKRLDPIPFLQYEEGQIDLSPDLQFILASTYPSAPILILVHLASFRFNQAKPKTDVEARVYEVLSHKNWGASTSLMNEIAQDTFDYERCKLLLC